MFRAISADYLASPWKRCLERFAAPPSGFFWDFPATRQIQLRNRNRLRNMESCECAPAIELLAAFPASAGIRG